MIMTEAKRPTTGSIGRGADQEDVMPPWLAQMMAWLMNDPEPRDAAAWRKAFFDEISRLDGAVPTSVVHDWMANVIGPLAMETRPAPAHATLAALQALALSGEQIGADRWRQALTDAFHDIYGARYLEYAKVCSRPDTYDYAHAYAHAVADPASPDYRARVTRLATGLVECLRRA